jgi:DNA-binding MarR family transcriptional regulator
MAFRTAIDELHERLAKMGFDDVRPVHGFVFQLLSFGGTSGNEIAEHLGITKQAASQMIEYLEQRGYVTRQPHPQDARGKIVTLSERGWNCIRETEAILSDIERHWAEVLGDRRLEELRVDLRQLVLESNGGVYPRRIRPVW